MRKVILCVAVTFDGYIEGLNKEIDWLSFTEETGKVLNRFLDSIDTVLYGRTSYEMWGTYSPNEDSAEFEKHFYERLNKMTKYVFSSTKNTFDGNPVVVQSGIENKMQQLKQQPGKDIWLYGGSKLITTFMNLDLVDEFKLAVYPVILGAGTPLFKDIDHRVNLQLSDVKAGEGGVMEITYQRKTAK